MRQPNEPKDLIYYWPLGRASRTRMDEWLGMWNWSANPPTVESTWEGAEVICQGWDRRAWEYHRLTLRMPDDLHEALAVEVEAIPCPKVRRGTEVKYSDYHWRKLLKRGWEIIE